MGDLRRISYVEDEADIRAITELALKTLGGFELDISVNGVEALTRIPRYKPDLILLDVMMPGMTGPDVLKELSTHPDCGRVPVIFMTAKVRPSDMDGYRELGALDVIPKPFDPMGLPDRLRGTWAQNAIGA